MTSNTVISVEHLTKQYDLGVIGTGTISRDLNRWWARVRKQPDPYTRIGQKDAFEHIGESILALDDVSFQVQQGEALGIIGRNGAGKSTLLKILSRVTAPTSGVVKVKGRIGSLLEVGTGFHPELTGRENVYLNGAILGMRKDEVDRKFDEIVDFSGVEKFIDTPVKRYSSGMYVRLAFAVAAHLDPEILVVDEVLAVGDAEFQKKCLGKMGDVAGEGRTVLFVSHNMAAIENLCGRVLVLEDGMLSYQGNVQKGISFYLKNSDRKKKSIIIEGNKILSSVEIMNTSDETQTSFKIGSSFKIRFVLLSHPDFDINLGFGINSNLGLRITTIQSQYTGFVIPSTNESIVVDCEINGLILSPGEYGINIIISSKSREIIESIDIPFAFEINSSDYWNYGRLPRRGFVLANHEWKFR